MILSDKRGVQHIVLTLAALGLKHVIICPGSRNAPLVISFNRHPDFECSSIRDERSAAFFALGKAMELKEPVAVLCTSGTASLNFAPAIVEAYYQQIPLIVLTADRPNEWINQGDGQTMNQSDVYHNYIRKSFDLKEAQNPDDFWYNERCLSEGFDIALRTDKGPVHFNIPMSEPLYGTGEVTVEKPRVFKTIATEKTLSEAAVSELSQAFLQSKKIMVLAGQHAVDKKLEQLLASLAGFENLVVLTESTSNLHHPLFIAHIDRCITGLTPETTAQLSPDLLITIGGAIVSKRIKSLLRKHRPAKHWNIHPYDATMDTYQSLTDAIAMEPLDFWEQITPQLSSVPSDYNRQWQVLKEEKEKQHQAFCKKAAFSDFKVFQLAMQAMPGDMHLHVANSSPIRYAQLFPYAPAASTWSNRGVSGIDGCTSTAMGAAVAAPDKRFLLITGDVAFHYDINAFWHDTPVQNLNILLINNSGGGIFRIIEGPDKVAERSQYLETSMQNSADKIASHFGWNYLAASDEAALSVALKLLYQPNTQRTILEVFTDADLNPKVLEQYWDFIK